MPEYLTTLWIYCQQFSSQETQGRIVVPCNWLTPLLIPFGNLCVLQVQVIGRIPVGNNALHVIVIAYGGVTRLGRI